jgi:hypothetical protein
MLQTLKTLWICVSTGQFIVHFVRHLVKTAGNIAESAFMLAVIYVTVNNVAHQLVTWILPAPTILACNQIAVIMFSVLPELIVVGAILKTYDQWCTYKLTGDKPSMLWAIAYSLPTSMFVAMTVATLASFSDVQASSNVSPTATGAMLVSRCLSGWFYGLIQMMYAERKRQSHVSHLRKLKGDQDLLRSELQSLKLENQSLKKKLTRPKGDQSTKNDHHLELVNGRR